MELLLRAHPEDVGHSCRTVRSRDRKGRIPRRPTCPRVAGGRGNVRDRVESILTELSLAIQVDLEEHRGLEEKPRPSSSPFGF